MLLRQYLCRRHKSRLIAVFDGMIAHGGAHGGLARADVALYQTVHRRGLVAHIAHTVADRSLLGRGQLIRQAVDKLCRVVLCHMDRRLLSRL